MMVLEWVESQCDGPSGWETTSLCLGGVGKMFSPFMGVWLDLFPGRSQWDTSSQRPPEALWPDGRRLNTDGGEVGVSRQWSVGRQTSPPGNQMNKQEEVETLPIILLGQAGRQSWQGCLGLCNEALFLEISNGGTSSVIFQLYFNARLLTVKFLRSTIFYKIAEKLPSKTSWSAEIRVKSFTPFLVLIKNSFRCLVPFMDLRAAYHHLSLCLSSPFPWSSIVHLHQTPVACCR